MYPSRVSVIIPAAGASRRFGESDKLAHPIRDRSVLEWVVAGALSLRALEVIVVARTARDAFGARLVVNPDADLGMGSSISCGVRAAAVESEGFLIWPGDMPYVAPNTARAVVRAGTASTCVRPEYLGTPGHPVFFGGSRREELGALAGRGGARSLLTDVHTLRSDDRGCIADIDILEDIPLA